jgi:5-methylcytosine-specific restriction endonuclease McrA
MPFKKGYNPKLVRKTPYPKGEKSYLWKGGMPKCLDCGKNINDYRNIRCWDCSQIKENHWNWQGGISFEEYPYEWKDDLKESIRKRDNYICQLCGVHQDELKNGQLEKLDIHHKDYNKKNLNPDNLISLCRSCHVKTNYNREYWLKLFNK